MSTRQIYVPVDLHQLMKAAGRDHNWSKIACRAFAEALMEGPELDAIGRCIAGSTGNSAKASSEATVHQKLDTIITLIK